MRRLASDGPFCSSRPSRWCSSASLRTGRAPASRKGTRPSSAPTANCRAAVDASVVRASAPASHTPMKHRRRAFTLVELLTVVAIIVVLIAILLPVLSKVREAGRRTQCAAQLRQIGVGLHRYFNEWKALPARFDGLQWKNPHVFKYKD